MSSLATEDVAVPGDILCMVLRQNVGHGQTKNGTSKQLLVFFVLLFLFVLF